MKNWIRNLIGCFLATSTLVAHAVDVDYGKLSTPPGIKLPYGEPISLYGTLSQLHTDSGESLNNWLDITKLRITYSIPGQAEQTIDAQLDPESGEWRVLLPSLPKATILNLRVEAIGTLSEKSQQRLASKLTMTPRFNQLVEDFFDSTAGKSSQTTKDAFNSFINFVEDEIDSNLPGFLKILRGGRVPMTASLREDFRSMLGMKTYIDEIKKIAKRDNIPLTGISPTDFNDPGILYKKTSGNINEQKNKDLKRAINKFRTAYEKTKSVIDKVVEQAITQVSVKSELSVSTQVEDLQKYAGIDIGALYAPSIDEMRQFLMVNIYYGAIEDQPDALNSEKGLAIFSSNYWRSRLSLSAGMSTGDFSSNGNSDIKDDKAYALGLGFRLNKYFRIGFGAMLYRATDEKMKRKPYFSLSMDLTAFQALQGLVSK